MKQEEFANKWLFLRPADAVDNDQCRQEMEEDLQRVIDFHLSLQEEISTDKGEPYPPNDQTITCRALRKKGTDLWYRDSKRAKPTEGLSKVYPVNYNHAFAPYDAELVEIECRVTKIIEP